MQIHVTLSCACVCVYVCACVCMCAHACATHGMIKLFVLRCPFSVQKY
jgi:hypothetical protein